MSEQKHVQKIVVQIGRFTQKGFLLPSTDGELDIIVAWVLTKVDFEKGKINFDLSVECNVCGVIAKSTIAIPEESARAAYREDKEPEFIGHVIRRFLSKVAIEKLVEDLADFILAEARSSSLGYGDFLN